MKIFKTGTTVNFIDENDVVLVYDVGQYCCEGTGWFIADKPMRGLVLSDVTDYDNLDGWVFDPLYCNRVYNPKEFGDGGMVIFRIVSEGWSQYVHLYNCHGDEQCKFKLDVGGNILEGHI